MSEHKHIIRKDEQLIIEQQSRTLEDNFKSAALLIIGIAMFIPSIPTGSFFLFATSICLILGAAVIWGISTTHDYLTITLEEKLIRIEHQHNKGMKEKDTQYTFVIKNIKRIYVKKERKTLILKGKKSNKSIFYAIWIEKNNGQEVRMLGVEEGFWETKEKEAQKIAKKISTILVKDDYLKAKSILKNIPSKPIISPRQISKEQDTAKLEIQDLREGILFDFYHETWEVIGQIQYDWKLDNTDMLYQIKNGKNRTIFLFVCQNLAIYTTWIEERLTQHDLMNDQLDKISENLPLEFTFREVLFLKEHFNLGYEFVSKTNQGVKIKQWKYISEDGKKSLRILEHDDKDTFVFLGKKVEEFDFSNILIS